MQLLADLFLGLLWGRLLLGGRLLRWLLGSWFLRWFLCCWLLGCRFLGCLLGSCFLGGGLLGCLLGSCLLGGGLLGCFLGGGFLSSWLLLWCLGLLGNLEGSRGSCTFDLFESSARDASLESEFEVSSSVVSDLVVGADVLEDGLSGRSRSFFQGDDGGSNHFRVFGMISWFGFGLGLLGFLGWSSVRHFSRKLRRN